MVSSTSNYGILDPYSLMFCRGLTPAANQSNATAHSLPHSGTGKELEGQEGDKLLGWDKDSLKAKQEIHKSLLMGTQMFSRPQDSRAPSSQQWLGKVNTQCECSPIPSSPPSFTCWAWCEIVWDIPQVGWVRCPSCVPSWLLCTPSLLTDGVGWEAIKDLTLCNLCSAVMKTLPMLFPTKIQTKLKWIKLPLPLIKQAQLAMTDPCDKGCLTWVK